jgi:hypothetical protein
MTSTVEEQVAVLERRLGSKLWHFTDAEVQAILDIVTEAGWRVADHWGHGDGVSIRVVPE